MTRDWGLYPSVDGSGFGGFAGDNEHQHYHSTWHEDRENASKQFKRILETHPHKSQWVLNAFLKINKPTRRYFGLLVNYYARCGDKHHACSTFESTWERGIETNSYVYTNLVHAYAVARDMRGEVSCVDEMEAEYVELNVETYSILISGYANIGDVEVLVWGGQEEMYVSEFSYLQQHNKCTLQSWYVASSWYMQPPPDICCSLLIYASNSNSQPTDTTVGHLSRWAWICHYRRQSLHYFCCDLLLRALERKIWT